MLLGVGIALLMRWGFRPLRQVREDLRKVRDGDIQHLQGVYPSEIEPLVDDLNALINSNREIVERARTHVGNLAHALKTPLAVLQNEASRLRRSAGGEGCRADRRDAQPGRASPEPRRIAAQANVLGAVTPVEPVIAALSRVMAKVHGDRRIAIDMTVLPELRFRGERQDFEEMAGNLLDNACKWAASEVRVTACRETQREAAGRRPFIILAFDDDGPGLPAADRAAALVARLRLDEIKARFRALAFPSSPSSPASMVAD